MKNLLIYAGLVAAGVVIQKKFDAYKTGADAVESLKGWIDSKKVPVLEATES